jgi:hypothetical protein
VPSRIRRQSAARSTCESENGMEENKEEQAELLLMFSLKMRSNLQHIEGKSE